MDIFTMAVWVSDGGVFCVYSFIKDKTKTKKAFKMAFGMGRGMLGSILSIVFLIGLVLTILPPQQIAGFVEKQNVLLATVVAAAFGTITLVPAFIAFPLGNTRECRCRCCTIGCISYYSHDGWYCYLSS